MEIVDKDRRVADAYRTLGDDRYKDTFSHCTPDFLKDDNLLVPGPRTWAVESPPAVAAEAFRAACTVGDLFSYFPLAIKIRIGSVISKEVVKHVRGHPVDATTLSKIGYRGDLRDGPIRFTAKEVRALIRNQAWRVSGLALDDGIHPAGLRALRLSSITNLDIANPYFSRINGTDYHELSRGDRLVSLTCLLACPALRRLVLSRRYRIRDLAPVASLQHLEELDLHECISVTDLSPLARCPRLTELELGMCLYLEDAALQPLAEIASLRSLGLSFCRRITRLPNLTSLTDLGLQHCDGIQDLAACGLPEQLTTLALSWWDEDEGRGGGDRRGVNLFNLAPLALCTRLTTLKLGQASRVGSLGGMAPLADLPLVELSLEDVCPGPGPNDPEYYDSDGEPLDEPRGGPYPSTIDLTPIGQIKTLVKLNLNYIGDRVGPDALAVVRSLPALEDLKMSGNGSDDRDPVSFRNFHHLAGHPNLRKLDMGFARLTEADIAFLPSLPELAFLETHLSNLDMSVVDAILKRCPKLKYARI